QAFSDEITSRAAPRPPVVQVGVAREPTCMTGVTVLAHYRRPRSTDVNAENSDAGCRSRRGRAAARACGQSVRVRRASRAFHTNRAEPLLSMRPAIPSESTGRGLSGMRRLVRGHGDTRA